MRKFIAISILYLFQVFTSFGLGVEPLVNESVQFDLHLVALLAPVPIDGDELALVCGAFTVKKLPLVAVPVIGASALDLQFADPVVERVSFNVIDDHIRKVVGVHEPSGQEPITLKFLRELNSQVKFTISNPITIEIGKTARNLSDVTLVPGLTEYAGAVLKVNSVNDLAFQDAFCEHVFLSRKSSIGISHKTKLTIK